MPWWLWPITGCEEQCPSSGEQGREQGRELSRSQEAGGARYQPGEALHSWTPPERWQDCWSWPLGNSACKCYSIRNFRSLLCTIFSGLFILACRRLITSSIYRCYCNNLLCCFVWHFVLLMSAAFVFFFLLFSYPPILVDSSCSFIGIISWLSLQQLSFIPHNAL